MPIRCLASVGCLLLTWFAVLPSQPAAAETPAAAVRTLPPVSDSATPIPAVWRAPLDADQYVLPRASSPAEPVHAPALAPAGYWTVASQGAPSNDSHPCHALADEKPLAALGIGIGLPAGELPTDYAETCWQHINHTAGPLAALRFWPMFLYQWDPVSFCHKPLYFEEINLERYGYGCCDCLQPLVSAAHFFATVPALPYCMTAEPPHECVYTLGHYRPGSCPPWRHHWPPCDARAAAVQAGVVTGMIFLIP